MQITKRGNPKSKKTYEKRCDTCGCEFTFKHNQVSWYAVPTRPGERSFRMADIVCPEQGCDQKLRVYE